MKQSELDLELLAVRVADDKRYFLTIEDCAEKYGCDVSQWLRWSVLGLVPKPYTIAEKQRWGVKQLAAWEKEQGIEDIALIKRDRVLNDLANTSEWTDKATIPDGYAVVNSSKPAAKNK